MRLYLFIVSLSLQLAVNAQFSPKVGEDGCIAVKNTNSAIIGWANACTVERGWQDVANTSLGKATYGEPYYATGKSDPAVVSLGDGGMAVLTFDEVIVNREGFDIAVFENAFDDYFLELAHVEVSSDGFNYVRFPSVSNTSIDIQIDPYGTLDAEKIHNLAGKYRAQYGTPFDLEELKDCTSIDINNINFVRVVDVVGSVNPSLGSYDSEGKLINDPYPTNFPNGGFDLDAVAILDMSLSAIDEDLHHSTSVHPNPVISGEEIHVSDKGMLFDVYGRFIQNIEDQECVMNINPGLYFFNTGDKVIQIVVE